MLFEDSQKDLDICSQLFPNLTWVIESDSPNRVLYEGKSSTALSLQILGSLQGYRASLMWNHDAVLIATAMPNNNLLAVLQEVKTEWNHVAEGMK